jgi:hypothetical protein
MAYICVVSEHDMIIDNGYSFVLLHYASDFKNINVKKIVY